MRMFFLLKSNKAYNRTTAHPLDSAVRIAHHEDDLAALHYRNKSRAVIFKRALPPGVIDDMRCYNQHLGNEKLNRRPQVIWGPHIKISPFGNQMNLRNMSAFLQTRTALASDIFQVAQSFSRISGRKSLSIESASLVDWFMDMADTDTKKQSLYHTEPHIDQPSFFERRMTCGYAEHPDGMGTGWFPGTFSPDEVRHIQREYSNAANPEAVLRQYNHQKTDAGDLLYFRTQAPVHKGNSSEHSLLHNSPMPPAKKNRLCLLLPT